MRRIEGDILALDLATKMGWACGPADPKDGKIIYDTVRLAPVGAGADEIFAGMHKWIADRLTAFPPAVVVYEQPVAPSTVQGHTNVSTIEITFGLAAIVRAVATILCVPRGFATISEVRKYFIGRGNLKSAEAKKQVMQKCRSLGYEPPDDNAGDALALHRFIAGVCKPELQLEVAPLFKPVRK